MLVKPSGYKRYRVNIDESHFVLLRNDPAERSTEFYQKPDNITLFKIYFIEKDRDRLKQILLAFDAGVRHGKRLRPRINRKKREI